MSSFLLLFFSAFIIRAVHTFSAITSRKKLKTIFHLFLMNIAGLRERCTRWELIPEFISSVKLKSDLASILLISIGGFRTIQRFYRTLTNI